MQKVVLFLSVVGLCIPLIAKSAELRLEESAVEIDFTGWVEAMNEVDLAYQAAHTAAVRSKDVRKMKAEINKMINSANRGQILLLPNTIPGLHALYNAGQKSRRPFAVVGQYTPHPIVGPYSPLNAYKKSSDQRPRHRK